jgi:nicotinamidase-related amidase
MHRNRRPIGGRIVLALAVIISFSVGSLYGFSAGIYHWPLYDTIKSFKETLRPDVKTYRGLHESSQGSYTLTTSRLSHFALDSNGSIELVESLPCTLEKRYQFKRTIDPSHTAMVVMDPWIDMPSEFLNDYYMSVTKSRIIPLVKQALSLGHLIIILTNDPDKAMYNSKIDVELQTLVKQGKADLLFHQDLDDVGFADYCRSKGITSLIYTGFASNMCIIGRKMGMIYMGHQGFKIFFVPDASAAVEYADSWQDKSLHKATTKIISQWIAEIVDYDEFIKSSLDR